MKHHFLDEIENRLNRIIIEITEVKDQLNKKRCEIESERNIK